MGGLPVSAETALRFSCFAGVLLVMLCWEAAAPRLLRAPAAPPGRRWTNLALAAIDALLLRLLLPLAALGAAFYAADRGIGAFNLIPIPGWAAWLATFVLLDLAIWAQHVAMHKVPLLWRLHRVHHTDVTMDVTTGVRFHPVEILLSMLYKIVVVLLIGAPPGAVVAWEVALNAASLLTHGNVRLPLQVDRVLRWLVVTPDMHRVHHSVRRVETDSNYGFLLSLWDKAFGTYRASPIDGHERMAIGLASDRGYQDQRLCRLLLLPFVRQNRAEVSVAHHNRDAQRRV